MIYYQDGVKKMRPVLTREDYLSLRGSEQQKAILKAVRERPRVGDQGSGMGNDQQKQRLVQMNYSCLPNEDGSLKGSTKMSTTVGMDIDHITAEERQPLRERILSKKDELGLLMLELSARAQGYHLVFRRRPELSQEENLKWASELLKVEFDKGAKDITRVFFTTTEDEENLLYLDDEIFEKKETLSPALPRNGEGDHAGSLSLGNKPDGSPHYGGDVRQDREGLLRAASKTLELKGDQTTGWSTGWRVNLYARLHDAKNAYHIYRKLLSYVSPDGYRGPDARRGGGTYPNLLDAHSPFQIDGNFGGCAGVVEMLMQSEFTFETTKSAKYGWQPSISLELLPALPDNWKDGSVSGIRARGGITVDMTWADSRVTALTLTAQQAQKIQLTVNGELKQLKLKKGRNVIKLS